MRKKFNLTDLIGNTPIIRLHQIEKSFNLKEKNIKLYAKIEGANIGGSIKDRVALSLIEDLESKGYKLALKKREKTIIEPSSGNTGIGLAMIGANRGYRVKIFLPENATPERTAILKFYGAEVDYCTAQEWSGSGALEKIKRLVNKDESLLMPNQYENPANIKAHYEGTGKEIIQQLPSVTHLFSSIGTGGTITGTSKKLKEFNPQIQTIGAEIKVNSKIPGPRSLKSFIPPVLDLNLIDKRMMINDENAVFKLNLKLGIKEGLMCGVSSAGALHCALQFAQEIEGKNEKNFLIIFPDRGEKYLSLILKN